MQYSTGNRADRQSGKQAGGRPAGVPVCPCARLPDAGFSLLEILIAIGLLAFLSLGIFQATTRSWDANTSLSREANDATAIILSLDAIRADLEQLFTPTVGPAAPVKEGEQAQEFWSAPVRSDGMRRSRFKGAAEKVTFVTNNNRRVEAESTTSDFQKITWEVERASSGTFTLYRISDWDAFRYEEDRGKKPEKIAVLENLSSAKFNFYRRSDKSWQDTWDSESAYAKEDSRFPDLVKLKIEAPDPTNNANQLAWEIVVKPNLAPNYLDATTRAALKARMD